MESMNSNANHLSESNQILTNIFYLLRGLCWNMSILSLTRISKTLFTNHASRGITGELF